jgi:hypothetical protein
LTALPAPGVIFAMPFPPQLPDRLAPIQTIMLQDSLNAESGDPHSEQVEIIFKKRYSRKQVSAAWASTVAETEVLQLGFSLSEPGSFQWKKASSWPDLRFETHCPPCMETWRAANRRETLLSETGVPWRTWYWENDQRFVWAFHHALLDGRSIARVLRSFLLRLGGHPATPLRLAGWLAPSATEVALAGEIFDQEYRPLPPALTPLPAASHTSGPAIHCLGPEFARRLHDLADQMKVTAPSLLTWAWGQALAMATHTEAVMVEQVRSGHLPEGFAGFTMNTLPVVIPLAKDSEVEAAVQNLRQKLLRLRAIERVSRGDFPPGRFPDTDAPGISVIMIERGTLHHMVGAELCDRLTHSITLHERAGAVLTAMAHILPRLRLEVEGPGRSILLEGWITQLMRLVHR